MVQNGVVCLMHVKKLRVDPIAAFQRRRSVPRRWDRTAFPGNDHFSRRQRPDARRQNEPTGSLDQPGPLSRDAEIPKGPTSTRPIDKTNPVSS